MAKLRDMKRAICFRRRTLRVERRFSAASARLNAGSKSRSSMTTAGAAAMLCVTGCSRAPSFNILGSFFPAWLLCGLLGIVFTVIVRLILVRTGFEKELSSLILVYPCLAAFLTFSIWLVFYS
jgi:hypothetical protein